MARYVFGRGWRFAAVSPQLTVRAAARVAERFSLAKVADQYLALLAE